MKIDSTTFHNTGTLSNEKSLIVFSANYAGQLVNTSSAVLNNKGCFEVLSAITIDGKFNNAGQFTLGTAGQRPSKIAGSGSITNKKAGTFVMAGNLMGHGPFVNLSTLRIVHVGPMQEGFWVRNTFASHRDSTRRIPLALRRFERAWVCREAERVGRRPSCKSRNLSPPSCAP